LDILHIFGNIGIMSVVESALTAPTQSQGKEVLLQVPTALSTMPNFRPRPSTERKSDVSTLQSPNVIEEGSVTDCNDVEHHSDHFLCFDDIDDVLTIFDPFPSSEYKSDLLCVDSITAISSSLKDSDIVFSPNYPDKLVIGDFDNLPASGGESKRKVSLGYFSNDSPESKRMCSSLESLPPLPLDCDESGTDLLLLTESQRLSPRIEKLNDFTSCDKRVIPSSIDTQHFRSFQNPQFDDRSRAVCSLDSSSSNASATETSTSSHHDVVSESISPQNKNDDDSSKSDSLGNSDYQSQLRHGLEKLIIQHRKTSESRQQVLHQIRQLNQTKDIKDLPKSNPICFSKSQISANECAEAAVTMLVDMNEYSSDSTASDCQDDDLLLFDFDEPAFQQ
jgi:hypothetical protein